MSEKIKIKLVKSPIGTKKSHKSTVRGLGLRKLNQTVELVDTPQVRGMLHKVGYLLAYEG